MRARNLFLMAAGVMSLLIMSCSTPIDPENGELTKEYSVTFNSQGGSIVQTINNIKENTTIIEPSAPIKTDDVFLGWYPDRYGIEKWMFSTDTVQSNITLYAKWNLLLKGIWNVEGTSYNVEYTNETCTIDADYPDRIVGYDNQNKVAILFWTTKSKYSKIVWQYENASKVNVRHYSEVSTWEDAINAETIDLEYNLLK